MTDAIAATTTSAVADKVAEVESGRLCIRYLTPRECLRLMGQSEDAIDKIMVAEPSKTRQYKMAETQSLWMSWLTSSRESTLTRRSVNANADRHWRTFYERDL